MERNCLGNFCRGPYEEHLCEIILNLGQQFRKRCCFKIFLYLALATILFGKAKPFDDFCSGPYYEEHLGETILNLGQQLRKMLNHLENFGRRS